MSLVQFVDHCYSAHVAIQQWMIFKSSGSAVQGDYLADAQDDAYKARELLKTVQAELAATLDAGGEAAKQADTETAAAVILIAESANAGIDSFRKAWEQHRSSIMAVAIRRRVKDGAAAVKPPIKLDREQAAEIADAFIFEVRSRFEYEARPVDHFWSVVKYASDAGVYDLRTKKDIHEAIAAARRTFEHDNPWPAEKAGNSKQNKNTRMLQAIDDDPRRADWNSKQWSDFLDTDEGYVRKLATWKEMRRRAKFKL